MQRGNWERQDGYCALPDREQIVDKNRESVVLSGFQSLIDDSQAFQRQAVTQQFMHCTFYLV